ncbi:MAG: AzlD domain-containing protein [Anaerovoracaceae bacterium]
MKVLISIIVMAVVTYIPRVFPLVVFRRPINNVYIRSFLHYVPYAVLSALTFPSILWSTGSVVTAVAGTLTAILLAYFEQSLVVVAVAAILVVYAAGALI